jgi:hypothetical protein
MKGVSKLLIFVQGESATDSSYAWLFAGNELRWDTLRFGAISHFFMFCDGEVTIIF